MSATLPLANKRVLVTGAGTGIGSGVALACAKAGADVAVHYSHSKAGADETVNSICALGKNARAFKADLVDLNAVRRLSTDVVEFLGGVDVLVNNAGITFNSPFERVTAEQFDQVYNVNVRGAYFLTQSLLPSLKSGRGAIVNITSIHAFEGMQEHSVYAGTKGAIVASTRALAIELAPLGVRVNAIAPGCVPVNNYQRAIGEHDVTEMGRSIPVGHVGRPEDIGNAVVFLASDASSFVVGQTLVIDGGTTVWMPFGDQFRQPLAEKGVQFGRGYVPGVR
jgi:NAD(P)-dependent dehydrogenase (short-subunit alcohol dehydrogenase family)